MSNIIIEALKIETTIGAYAWEQEIKQPVILDLELSIDTAKAAVSDDLNDALDYRVLCDSLTEYVGNSQCKLLEHLAKKIINYIQQEFSVTDVKLRLSKMPHGLNNVGKVTVEMGSK